MDVHRVLANIKTIQGALQVIAMLQLTAHRFPQQAVVNDGDTFDFIVVGAGSAGTVLANRLTENPHVRVLLVEAGGDPPLESVLPSLMVYQPESPVDWNYTSTDDGYATQCHMNKVYRIVAGKVLGGCSSVNYMIYIRGDPVSFNDWANATNDNSWSYKNVLPYFIKSERLEDDEILQSDTAHLHGTNGYLGVTKSRNANAIPFLNSFHEIGHKLVLDINGNDRLGYGEFMVNAAGARQSTAESFLSPIKNRPNLYVLKNTLVTKILFDNFKHAIGVQLTNNNNEELNVLANIEVIVSAGAIGSAQLLMLSGIGPKRQLQKHRIPLLSDLPVGHNMKDHITLMLVHSLDQANTTSEPTRPQDIPVTVFNGLVSVDNTPYPNYQTLNFVITADVALTFCGFIYAFNYEICQKMYDQNKGKQVLFTLMCSLETKSTGQLSLRSPDPKDAPILDFNALSDPVDLKNYARYIRDYLKIQDSVYFKSNNAKMFHPDCVSGLDFGSDEYWRRYSLCMSLSVCHYSSTCAMGAVLDSRLRVLGVHRLRVVDASAMPNLPRANPNAAIMMLAEKAADIIKHDNGLF